MNDWRETIERIHASGRRVVLAITGGGSGAIGELLRVPGGSRTLVEAIVPYDERSLARFLMSQPVQACSEETAVAMARRARDRARDLAELSGSGTSNFNLHRHDDPDDPNDSSRRRLMFEVPDPMLVGVGVTASLASDRPKKGEHRCHIAAATDQSFRVASIVLAKGDRDRAGEEDLVVRASIVTLAAACGVAAPSVASLLAPGDLLSQRTTSASDLLGRFLAGGIDRVTVWPDGQMACDAAATRAVLAGSFNPLHAGHVELAHVASQILSTPVALELSIANVDKAPLAAAEVRRRLRQCAWHSRVELTRAPTFLEKSRLFPGTTFVVGADTAERIIDPKYYANSEQTMLAALAEIAAHACSFLVAGRANAAGRFVSLAELRIPAAWRPLFSEISEDRFHCDLRSTALRGRG